MYLIYWRNLLAIVILFTVTNAIQTVLIELNVLKTKDGQTIRLLSEFHKDSSVDQEQLAAMKNNVIQRDAESEKQLKIFIETPARLCNFFSDPKVTMNLADVSEESSLSKTEIEDVEIRCSAGAAQYILQPHLDPNYLFSEAQFNAQERWCVVGKNTFDDIKKEFDEYVSFLQEARNSYEDDVKEVFDEKLTQAKDDYKELENDLKFYKIALNENVLEVSKRLYADKPHDKLGSRHALSTRMFHVFDPLLELYILHKILAAKDIHEIVVIAGADHTQSVKSMLRMLGVKRVRSLRKAGPQDLEKTDVPGLGKDELDIFRDQWDFWHCCSIV